ncbi:MAG TPA: PEGA domain-containing protein [Acidobacteriota bacterium]|nr:PEGA domain-containing protein [Acidobacteriota bacterium]
MVRFKEAENIFNSANQIDSISMFQSLISVLESEAHQRELNKNERQILTTSYDLLAQAQYNNNEQANAEHSLLKLIEWNADYKMNEDLVSKKIIDLLNQIKRDNLAMLTVSSTPEGATVLLDGRIFGVTNFENQSVTKGKHKLEVRLDGYQRVAREIEIAPGEMREITIQLGKALSMLNLYYKHTL